MMSVTYFEILKYIHFRGWSTVVIVEIHILEGATVRVSVVCISVDN